MASEHPERERPDFYHYWINEEVRFHDLDAYNHVNNNVIGIYFETARMRWLEEIQPKGWTTGAHFVLAKNTIHFLRELTYPNSVRIGQQILRVGNTSMMSAGGVFLGDTAVALGETLSVWIGSKSRAPEPIREDVRQALGRYA
jgi:acyl-CoA thioester hydrolase